MAKFIGKRLLMLIPVLLGISLIIFLIMEFTPGDPAQMILGDSATPEAIQALREELGLNQNWFVRYVNYIGDILHGDFGRSYRTSLSVIDEILIRFPNSVILAAFGIGFATLVGVPIGIISAVKQYSIFDTVSIAAALLMTSIPAFWLGMMFLLVFALNLGWLPSVGVTSWTGYILPSITLAIGNMAIVIRMTRSSMLEVMREDYIRTARAKGLTERKVTMKHALQNALLPIVTVVGMNFGVQLGGAMICETVFSIPGMGTLIITSVRQKDVPVVLTAVLFVAFAISIVNLLVDVLYAFIDPRIKSLYAKAKR